MNIREILSMIAVVPIFLAATDVTFGAPVCEPFPPPPGFDVPASTDFASPPIDTPPPALRRVEGGEVGPPIYFVGDSLTIGHGAQQIDGVPIGVSQNFTSTPRRFVSLAGGGLGSSAIAELFSKEQVPNDAIGVIWAGRNNVSDGRKIIDDLNSIATQFGSGKFIVLSITPGLWIDDRADRPSGRWIASVNRMISAAFPDSFVRIGADLTCGDYADNLHLVDSGYAKIAEDVFDAISARGW